MADLSSSDSEDDLFSGIDAVAAPTESPRAAKKREESEQILDKLLAKRDEDKAYERRTLGYEIDSGDDAALFDSDSDETPAQGAGELENKRASALNQAVASSSQSPKRRKTQPRKQGWQAQLEGLSREQGRNRNVTCFSLAAVPVAAQPSTVLQLGGERLDLAATDFSTKLCTCVSPTDVVQCLEFLWTYIEQGEHNPLTAVRAARAAELLVGHAAATSNPSLGLGAWAVRRFAATLVTYGAQFEEDGESLRFSDGNWDDRVEAHAAASGREFPSDALRMVLHLATLCISAGGCATLSLETAATFLRNLLHLAVDCRVYSVGLDTAISEAIAAMVAAGVGKGAAGAGAGIEAEGSDSRPGSSLAAIVGQRGKEIPAHLASRCLARLKTSAAGMQQLQFHVASCMLRASVQREQWNVNLDATGLISIEEWEAVRREIAQCVNRDATVDFNMLHSMLEIHSACGMCLYFDAAPGDRFMLADKFLKGYDEIVVSERNMSLGALALRQTRSLFMTRLHAIKRIPVSKSG